VRIAGRLGLAYRVAGDRWLAVDQAGRWRAYTQAAAWWLDRDVGARLQTSERPEEGDNAGEFSCLGRRRGPNQGLPAHYAPLSLDLRTLAIEQIKKIEVNGTPVAQ